MQRMLKGGDFTNRYRITGKLQTLSPLHIGTGEESDKLFSDIARAEYMKEMGKVPTVSTVMKDHRGKPIIPGSTLRGVMRHWLLSVFQGISDEWAEIRDYSSDALLNMSQHEQNETARSEFSSLELLFGTPFNAGKLEVWDAMCLTADHLVNDDLLHWNSTSLTYIDTSVAIDPATGTAMDKLLYKTEVVAPGVIFELNIVGQNLSDEEVGLVLLALQAFNSSIYPIRLGARVGRGYGRMKFTPGDIHRLDQSGLKDWIRQFIQKLTVGSQVDESVGTGPLDAPAAGYFALPRLDETHQRTLISAIKTSLTTGLEG